MLIAGLGDGGVLFWDLERSELLKEVQLSMNSVSSFCLYNDQLLLAGGFQFFTPISLQNYQVL